MNKLLLSILLLSIAPFINATGPQCLCQCTASPRVTESPQATAIPRVTSTPIDIDDTPLPSPLNTPDVTTDDDEAFRDECLNDAECAQDQYCRTDVLDTFFPPDCLTQTCVNRPRACLPRLAVNETCLSIFTNTNGVINECSEGSACVFSSDAGDSKCLKRIEVGKECSIFAFGSKLCVEGTVCQGAKAVIEGLETGTCKARLFAGEGDQCNNDADCGEGLSCDPFLPAKCIKQKEVGEECLGNSGPNSKECKNGFCAQDLRGIEGGSSKGICLEYSSIGGPCRVDTDCGNSASEIPPVVDSHVPLMVCNKQDDLTKGACFNQSVLITELGGKCNKKLDACDGRRGLVCDDVDGKSICVQRHAIDPLTGEQASSQSAILPCTPGSPLSTCPLDRAGRETECRRPLSQSTKVPYGISQCLPVQEVVKLGDVCNDVENAICEEGATCETAPPGVSTRPGTKTQNFATVRYCMRTLPAGSVCSNKDFKNACPEGSFCIDGACKTADTPPDVPITFIGLDDDCAANTTCAPGLQCTDQGFGSSICRVSTVLVGNGEDCSRTATTLKVTRNSSLFSPCAAR